MVNLTDGVGDLEKRLDSIQLGVGAMKSESNTMKSEVQSVEKNITFLLEHFEWMRARWKEQQ